ncbi:multi-sensor signal transduction histidine kinase [Natronococcus amylolyticus DSM 10524]|uniref:histidine kinase n=1 Tax=Natronococcus amylolyticus DSM 10524 TaxID=1227497 RepID=L9WYT7_9EURY|nr:PAS domain S-box protein [Natronococcus amylolyticus]ELY54655.1 multi-sensor signal transduction histidine kinase [Natronococcus amylolyticus DSM 10524]
MDSGPPDEPVDNVTQPTRPTGSRLSLLEAADVPSVQLAKSGTIDDVTEAFASLSGYDRSELIGRQFSALLDEGSASLERTVAEGNRVSPSTTGSLQTRAETVVDVEIRLERVPTSESDSEPGAIAIVDPRPTRETTAEPTYGRTFEALADALPDGIIVLDADSQIRYANPAVERILGYDPEALVGASKVDIIPPRLRERHLEALKRYLETGERNLDWTYVELPGQHRDGHEVPLGVSLNDFFHDGDRYFVGLFRDVSPRKEVEETLTAKVAQLESVAYLSRYALENGDVDELLAKATDLVIAALDVECCAVLETDATGSRSHDASFRVRATTGCGDALTEGETASPSPADSLAAAARDGDGPIAVESFETDDRFDGTPLLSNRDVRSGIGVAIGPAADSWGILAAYDDRPREFADHDVDFLDSVSTILATALERRRYERRLNEMVRELEASNERLEQFAYAASHDLQEPLRMVSSYLGLIESRYADDLDIDGKEFIEYAVDGADRMREMIDGLLAYSRIDSQGDPFEPVDLEAVLEDVLTDLQVMIERHDAEITAESLPTVQGDTSQLRQLLQNLVSNAIEYSGDEPPRVHVGADRAGDRWEIAVRDEGVGIDPDEQERVFEVFQRLHGHDECEGTGIGLAICRRIVERHGGRIRVDSGPGEGATFTFTLPATES